MTDATVSFGSSFTWCTILPIVLDTLRRGQKVDYNPLFASVQQIAERDYPEQAHRKLKNRSVVEDRVRWAVHHGRRLKFIRTVSPGMYELTPEGEEWLGKNDYPLDREQVKELRARYNETDGKLPSVSLEGEPESSESADNSDFVWLLRAGRVGEREEQALHQNIGIPGMDFGPEVNSARGLEEIRSRIIEHHPNLKPGQVNSFSNQLHKFQSEMQVGDLVLMPSKLHKGRIYYGTVAGGYEYQPDAPQECRHIRPIKWSPEYFHREDLGRDLQQSLGSMLTICKVSRNNAFERISSIIQGGGDPAAEQEFSEHANFEWIEFYQELASKILEFRDDREGLLGKLKDAAELSERPLLFKYLWHWHIADKKVPARDIDPFTVLGIANRSIKWTNKTAICRALKSVFGLVSPVPEDFSGIPVLNNQKSVFSTRPADVTDGGAFFENVWHLFDAALALTDLESAGSEKEVEAAREKFADAFDNATSGRKHVYYTMGLFWARPNRYLSLDSVNLKFLERDSVLGTDIQKSGVSGAAYLELVDGVRDWLENSDLEPATFASLSYEAFLDATQEEEQPSHGPGSDDPAFTVPQLIADGCFVPEADIYLMLERWREKKNLILQGPPGTGKTWLARRLAYVLCQSDADELITAVQFHPSTSYEDFVQGFRPSSEGKLELVDGPFLRAVEQANEDSATPHVLVIEEINRGNPAQIFGEMLTLLEADKRNPESALTTLYGNPDEPLFLPSNLYVIGTMNQADRSLAMVDFALRRRFAFIDLAPRLGDAWRDFCITKKKRHPAALDEIARRISEVNEIIRQDGTLGAPCQIGHSFVTPVRPAHEQSEEETMSWFESVVASDLRPLLEEYWFDNPEALRRALNLLQGG